MQLYPTYSVPNLPVRLMENKSFSWWACNKNTEEMHTISVTKNILQVFTLLKKRGCKILELITRNSVEGRIEHRCGPAGTLSKQETAEGRATLEENPRARIPRPSIRWEFS